MKILMFSYLPPVLSGIATHTYHLSKELIERGHEVEIVSFLNKSCKKDGIKIYGIKGHVDIQDIYTIKTPYSVEKIKRIIEESNPDILHFHHRTSSIEFFLGKLKSDIPMINTVHSSAGSLDLSVRDIVHHLHYKKLSEILQKYSDHIITVSNFNKKKLVENGVNRKKVTVIRNGINPEEFKISKKEARKKLKIEDDEKIVLFAGRHVREKGLGYLLRAFKKIDDAKLFILGTGPLIDIYKTYKKLPYSKNNIIFKGNIPRDELPYYFSAADVFVLPSIYPEPQGIVLFEAMASRTAIVSTKVGGVPEVIRETKSGILVKPKSVAKLREAIKKLLGDENLRKKLASNGYKNVKKYTWKKVALKTEKIYKMVLKHN
ncbi:MAG: glycosyltransferase family 4 protein [Candidatus Aenigmarchaeota archaeon]|nr:glycosyltransferase family 4 protein [Candidatus Aenigmarchaeota archaeon]